VVNGNPSNTNRGEKMRPPPNPTMVRIKEERKMITNKRDVDIDSMVAPEKG